MGRYGDWLTHVSEQGFLQDSLVLPPNSEACGVGDKAVSS